MVTWPSASQGHWLQTAHDLLLASRCNYYCSWLKIKSQRLCDSYRPGPQAFVVCVSRALSDSSHQSRPVTSSADEVASLSYLNHHIISLCDIHITTTTHLHGPVKHDNYMVNAVTLPSPAAASWPKHHATRASKVTHQQLRSFMTTEWWKRDTVTMKTQHMLP